MIATPITIARFTNMRKIREADQKARAELNTIAVRQMLAQKQPEVASILAILGQKCQH